MNKITLCLSTLILLAGVSVVSANIGAPRVNGQNVPYGQPVPAFDRGYSAMYEGRPTVIDP